MAEVSSPPSASLQTAGDGAGTAAGRGEQRRRRGKRGGGRGNGGGATNENKDELSSSGEAKKVVDNDAKTRGQSTKSRSRRGRRGGRGNASQSNDNNTKSDANGGVKKALDAPSSPRTDQAMQFIADSLADSNPNNSDEKPKPNDCTGRNNSKQSAQRNRKARGKKKNETTNDANKEAANDTNNTSAPEEKKKKRRNRNRKSKQKQQKSCPWKTFIPEGAEDPISLDLLEDLPYPPFALVVDEPYVPIYPGMWPPQDGKDKTKIDDATNVEDEANRELQILKEQWGDIAPAVQKKNEPGNKKIDTNASSSIEGRRFNLFDGRALANYVVSELQFIDPFNRRDLTRGELQALDAYLAVHKLGTAGVVEAYDDNGTTISTAGAQAQTPGGRALMLQQRAQAIRDSLYRSGGSTQQQQQSDTQDMRRVQTWQGSNMREDNADIGGVTNQFQRMYAAHEREERGIGVGGSNNEPSNYQTTFQPDSGIYDEGGLLMIDDDINPGLRSQIVDSTRGNVQRISHEAQARDNSFPSLQNNTASEVAAAAPAPAASVSSKKVPKADGHSKGLSKIGKLVKQTDPKQLERQRKAREEANRRAELSRQMFFDPSSSRPETTSTGGLLTAPARTQQNAPSEAVIERNRNLAFALGVAPSTVRNEPSLTGWARPTTADIKHDEFGNELHTAQYPDALLAEAKERMTELIKLEKQWKKFLADDNEASCSLKAMLKPLRKMVHEYSDFWGLHTESFDPEPRRYIYCKKLADTAAPYPLLSEAARKWRGPVPGSSPAAILNTSQPSAAVAPVSSDGWRVEGRVPLKLAPRTIDEGTTPAPVATGMGMTRSSSTPFLSMTGEKPPPPRFANLHENERPKLQLTKRQIPPPDELDKRNLSPEQWEELDSNTQEQILREIDEQNKKKQLAQEREQRKIDARIHRQELKAKKKQDVQQKKQALLESVFASDDDDDDDSDNDWFEMDIAFDGSDDEGR